eukprot:1595945-Rhodomonas_salina.2
MAREACDLNYCAPPNPSLGTFLSKQAQKSKSHNRPHDAVITSGSGRWPVDNANQPCQPCEKVSGAKHGKAKQPERNNR